MKTLTVATMWGLLAIVSAGCAATKPAPSGPTDRRNDAGEVEVLTPFKTDPAFLVRFTLAKPQEWGSQRNLSTPPGSPDISLRLTHRETGAEIDFMFLPPARPADVAASLNGKTRGGFTAIGAVTTNASGERSGFTAESKKGGVRILSRVVVIRLPAMTDATLLIAAEWPASAHADTKGAFDALIASVTATPVGPPDAKTDLAMCLTQKGYRYYGASWCEYCRVQEEAFGPATSRLRHVDCSPPSADGAQILECADQKITSYPTWILPDGTRTEGGRALEDLAKESGCPYAPKK